LRKDAYSSSNATFQLSTFNKSNSNCFWFIYLYVKKKGKIEYIFMHRIWFLDLNWKSNLICLFSMKTKHGEDSKVYYNVWASCVDKSVVGTMGFLTKGLTIEEGPHLVLHPHYLKAWKLLMCSPMWN
jgi:hypothetical protein